MSLERRKLTATVHRLHAHGATPAEIQADLGLGPATVHNIIHPTRRRKREAPNPTWENAIWADGPRVVAWLERTGEITRCPLDRRVRDWRTGSRASVWALDRLFTLLGLHISQLPNEAWVSSRKEAA